jgi:prepilin-type N-terminal cleavage/methylation domain-containing protein
VTRTMHSIEKRSGRLEARLLRWPSAAAVIRSRLSTQEGFTLIELLVVIILAGVLGAAVLGILLSISGVFNSQGVRIQNQDDARTAINQMARYLRMATSSADNQTSQSNSIASALPQDIEFYCDVDGDGIAERARYYLQGTTLRMQSAEPTWVLTPTPHYVYAGYTTDGIVIQDAIRNASTAVFRYYRYNVSGFLEESPAPTTSSLRQQIVTVAISLTVNEIPKLAKGNVLLATDVQIRQRYGGGLQ